MSMPVGSHARAEYLSQAAEFFELRQLYEDALRCLLAARDDGGPTWIDVRVKLVSLHLIRGENDRADELAAELRRSLESVGNLNVAIEWLGDAFHDSGRLREAHRWFTIGLRDIDPEDLDEDDGWALGLLNGRSRARRELGLGHDAYDRAQDRVSEGLLERRRRTDGEWGIDAEATDAKVWTLIHWPAPEFELFAKRWPHLAEGYGGTFAQHRFETEQHLRHYAAFGATVAVGKATLTELLAYAELNSLDPSTGNARASYAAELGRTGQAVPWPPQRAEPCWCGSSASYGECCKRYPDRQDDPD